MSTKQQGFYLVMVKFCLVRFALRPIPTDSGLRLFQVSDKVVAHASLKNTKKIFATTSLKKHYEQT